MFKEYGRYDGHGLAERVRTREVSPAELLEAALALAEAVNPRLNAIITPMHDIARARAREPLDGPFAGVPFLVKDLFQEYAGVRAAYGGSFYAVPKKAANKAAAWDFIRLMKADAEVQRESLKALDSFPAMRAVLDDPVMDEPIAFLGGQRARQLWRETAVRIPAIPVNRFDALATTVIRDEFERVIARGKAIPEALADARRLIERRARRR